MFHPISDILYPILHPTSRSESYSESYSESWAMAIYDYMVPISMLSACYQHVCHIRQPWLSEPEATVGSFLLSRVTVWCVMCVEFIGLGLLSKFLLHSVESEITPSHWNKPKPNEHGSCIGFDISDHQCETYGVFNLEGPADPAQFLADTPFTHLRPMISPTV